MPANIVFMGIRGYWSVAFVYAGAMYWDYSERRIYPYVLAVFFLHFILQIIQRITGAGQDVYFEFRSAGLFMIPSTAGLFALLVHYFSIRFKSLPLKLLTLVSLVLSNSTGGLLIFITYYIYAYRNKIKTQSNLLSAICSRSFSTMLRCDFPSWRTDGPGSAASGSALTRLGIIYLALTNWTSLFFGMGMGIATSQAYLSGYSNAIIADNTFIGILYNAGMVPALLMLGFFVRSFRYFNNKLLALMLLGYSMTTVIFEINPVIQVMLILLGSDIGRKYAAAKKEIVPRKRKSMFRLGLSSLKPPNLTRSTR